MLGRAAAAGVTGARPLLDGAVAWQLARDLAAGFPEAEFPGTDPVPARAAWCYGDPGIAVGLLTAARAVGAGEWEERALATAERMASVGR